MPKSNKLLSTDHSHSHSFLLIFISFYYFSYSGPKTPTKTAKSTPKWPLGSLWGCFLAPLGVLFGTSGAAFWHPGRGKYIHMRMHRFLVPILDRFGSPKASQNDPCWHAFSNQNRSQNDVQKRYPKYNKIS